jgi:hypothetical protein
MILKKPTRLFLSRTLFIPILFVIFSLPSCQKRDDTQVIKDTLITIVRLAEKRNREKVLSYLAENYLDFQQRDVKQTDELVDYYFKNYRGIVIHLLDISVSIIGDEAEVEADVLLSSGPLETLRKLVGLAGSFYRFNFRFVQLGREWKISYSAWQEIDSNSLLPGSKVILKKLFPDLIQ